MIPNIEQSLNFQTKDLPIYPHKPRKKKPRNPEEKFLIGYPHYFTELLECKGAELKVFLSSFIYVEWLTNEIPLTPARRKTLQDATGLKKATVDSAISILKQRKFWIDVNGRTYLNPLLFYYGYEDSRDVFLKQRNFKIVAEKAGKKKVKKPAFRFSEISASCN